MFNLKIGIFSLCLVLKIQILRSQCLDKGEMVLLRIVDSLSVNPIIAGI